jgi:hypothetical protein
MKTNATQPSNHQPSPRSTSLWLSLLSLAVAAAPALADTVLWSEGFETYNTDAGQTYGGLDKNKSGSPNAAADGVGNPWFGPAPNNGWVTKAMQNPATIVETVTPHSGQFMMRGSRSSTAWYSAWDNDIDHVNIGYRFNGGAAFTANVSMSWWFYDILGNTFPGDANKGPGCFGDYAGLQYAATAPTALDYGASAGNLPASATLAIGAYEGTAGYDTSVYQVQVQGAADGQFGNGWFNTIMTRSKGWHNAVIQIDGNNIATLSIDGTVLLTHATGAPNGFNIFTTWELQVTPDTYNQSAYYDDITLTLVPEPSSVTLLGLGVAGLLRIARKHRR